MINVKVEKVGDKVYIRCPICNDVLATNDPDLFIRKFGKNTIEPLGSCSHFEVIDVHKDEKSLAHLQEYEKNAVFKSERKNYITLIVPRQS